MWAPLLCDGKREVFHPVRALLTWRGTMTLSPISYRTGDGWREKVIWFCLRMS